NAPGQRGYGGDGPEDCDRWVAGVQGDLSAGERKPLQEPDLKGSRGSEPFVPKNRNICGYHARTCGCFVQVDDTNLRHGKLYRMVRKGWYRQEGGCVAQAVTSRKCSSPRHCTSHLLGCGLVVSAIRARQCG